MKKKANDIGTMDGKNKNIGRPNIPPTQAQLAKEDGGPRSEREGRLKKNAHEKGNHSTREMTGAYRKDMQMAEQEQKHKKPKDNAENGKSKEAIIDETTQNPPS